MGEVFIGGFVLRFIQCLAQAAPFIITGLIVAGIFARMMNTLELRRLFGEGTKSSLFRAWLIGMLLPICSLGVIPVIRVMYRSRITAGTIMAFAMSAPLFNPLSLLYGLTLSEPVVILTFALCSLIIVTIAGILFDKTFKPQPEEIPQTISVPYGIKRVLAVGVHICREMAGASSGYILVGLAGVALLGAFLPVGALQKQANHDNIMAPVFMAAVSIPIYATPMLAMSQLGMMFQHVNSIGAGFVLLILGAGMNTGLLAWMMKNYGIKKSVVWFGMLMIVVLGIAYGVDKPLAPKGIEPADHTHAFDVYCQPFHDNETAVFTRMKEKLAQEIQPFEWYSLYILFGITFIGAFIQITDPRSNIEQWLEKQAPETANGKLDVILPGYVLAIFSLLVLVAVSIMGCYTYYPGPKESFEDMYIVKGEALSGANSGDYNHAKYWLEVLDDWTRKVQVGVYLRRWELSEYHCMKASLLRYKMELLEHEVEEYAEIKQIYKENPTPENKEKLFKIEAEVRFLVTTVTKNYNRMKEAYLNEL